LNKEDDARRLAECDIFFDFFAYKMRANRTKKLVNGQNYVVSVFYIFFTIYNPARPGCKKFVKMGLWVELRIDKNPL
jgi:hypothetical protein